MNANPTYPNVDVSEFPSQNPFFNFYGYNPFYHNFSQTKQFSLILNGLRTLPKKKQEWATHFSTIIEKLTNLTYSYILLIETNKGR